MTQTDSIADVGFRVGFANNAAPVVGTVGVAAAPAAADPSDTPNDGTADTADDGDVDDGATVCRQSSTDRANHATAFGGGSGGGGGVGERHVAEAIEEEEGKALDWFVRWPFAVVTTLSTITTFNHVLCVIEAETLKYCHNAHTATFDISFKSHPSYSKQKRFVCILVIHFISHNCFLLC